MRLLFLTIIVGALASIQLAMAQGTNATSRDVAVVKQIEQLEEARRQAILKGDAGAIERTTSDDYTFITVNDALRTKAEIVNRLASGPFKHHSRTISDLKIRLCGDTAVVSRTLHPTKGRERDGLPHRRIPP